MVITSTQKYTREQIEQLKEQFGGYIKTVIDIEKEICSAGCDRHFESEQLLLKNGSTQEHIWGGGIDTETKLVDFNSFINIRPTQNNPSNEILDPAVRKRYDELTRQFFAVLYEQ